MEDYREEGNQSSSLKGYKIVIIILAVVLGFLSFMYFRQVANLKDVNQVLAVEKDTLTNRLTNLVFEYDNIVTENETLNEGMEMERHKADSLLGRLTTERNLSYSKIKAYERELGTLRDVMRNFTRQIDSLNQVNRVLANENVTMRREVSSQRQRAEIAEEKADELNTKIRHGSVVRARDIQLLALNNSDRQVTRSGQARRMAADFVLSANELASPGPREVYVRIIGPDGYIMGAAGNNTFKYEGESTTYSSKREVDYQNQDLQVRVYYTGTDIVSGKYRAEIYMDGYMTGRTDMILK